MIRFFRYPVFYPASDRETGLRQGCVKHIQAAVEIKPTEPKAFRARLRATGHLGSGPTVASGERSKFRAFPLQNWTVASFDRGAWYS